jgi:hypothetical protein
LDAFSFSLREACETMTTEWDNLIGKMCVWSQEYADFDSFLGETKDSWNEFRSVSIPRWDRPFYASWPANTPMLILSIENAGDCELDPVPRPEAFLVRYLIESEVAWDYFSNIDMGFFTVVVG